MKRLVVYHPQKMMAVCLTDLIEKSERFTMLGAVSSTEELYSVAEKGDVDMILLSVSCTNTNTIKIVRELRHRVVGVRIAIYSQGEITNLFSFMSYTEGVTAILPHDINYMSMMMTLVNIANGEYITPIPHIKIKGRDKRLSRREIEVLNLVVEGLSLIQISSILGVNDKTVSTYKARLYKKLNVSNLVELVALYNSVLE
ncbi:MAG: response regulator transcription factor [Flavobacteriales bacterium]|nr:response regulator transcription factor [Flavobacteriales bacterium]